MDPIPLMWYLNHICCNSDHIHLEDSLSFGILSIFPESHSDYADLAEMTNLEVITQLLWWIVLMAYSRSYGHLSTEI